MPDVPTPDVIDPAANPRRDAGPYPWDRTIRVLAVGLLASWAALAIAILVEYRPAGPWDPVVLAAAFLPVPVAAAAVVWPPHSPDWREATAVMWLGIAAMLLVLPLIGTAIRTLGLGGHQTLLPSFEITYAWFVALGLLSFFASLGYAERRVGRPRRPVVLRAAGLAFVATAVIGVVLGGGAVANEVSLRSRVAVASRFGPTDAAQPEPPCDSPVLLGPGAVLSVEASAAIDGITVGTATLAGVRDGTDEAWTASLHLESGLLGPAASPGSGARSSLGPGGHPASATPGGTPSAPVTGSSSPAAIDRHEAAYRRVGGDAWLARDGGAWQRTVPDPVRLAGGSGLTVDGAIAGTLDPSGGALVVEDLGIDLVESAPARHCRIAIDGPAALRASLPLRWLAGGGLVEPARSMENWRGQLDWWLFADGQLGLSTIQLGGYPGEAWAGSGVQASLVARMTAVDRSLSHHVSPPDGSPPPAP
jgi:hypothetical protein